MRAIIRGGGSAWLAAIFLVMFSLVPLGCDEGSGSSEEAEIFTGIVEGEKVETIRLGDTYAELKDHYGSPDKSEDCFFDGVDGECEAQWTTPFRFSVYLRGYDADYESYEVVWIKLFKSDPNTYPGETTKGVGIDTIRGVMLQQYASPLDSGCDNPVTECYYHYDHIGIDFYTNENDDTSPIDRIDVYDVWSTWRSDYR